MLVSRWYYTGRMSSVDDDAYCVRFNSDMDIDEQEEALLDPSNPLAHAVKAHLHGASLEHGKAKVVVSCPLSR